MPAAARCRAQPVRCACLGAFVDERQHFECAVAEPACLAAVSAVAAASDVHAVEAPEPIVDAQRIVFGDVAAGDGEQASLLLRLRFRTDVVPDPVIL